MSLRRRLAASGGLRRPNFRGAGGISDILLRLPTGTFSRSSEAYALGSDALLDKYLAHELRTEYRSDLGLYLLEGERTNLLTRSEEFDHADWDAGTNSATITPDVIAAPDGNSTADLVEDDSGTSAERVRQTVAVPNDSATYTFSLRVKPNTSDIVDTRFILSGGTVKDVQCEFDLTNKTFTANAPVDKASIDEMFNGWLFISVTFSNNSSGNTSLLADLFVTDRSTDSDTGSVYFWGAQLEEAEFPSSYIRTTTAAATRAADTLTFASGDVPERVLSGKFTQQFRPYAASADLSSGDEQWLLSLGGASNGIRIRHDGTNVLLEYLRGGVVITASAALTYSRHQLMSYTLDHSTGDLTVSGATSGDGTTTGTSGSWTAATTRVGGVQAGANEAFIGLGNLEKAA